ncbi:hypothetical protein LTR78_007480 [Recurvomyces mirabilis]|uniref:Uncharacterized protein n=1 Tax=Recurvomyces mirabilis TaxID=574656 RepID=A0AAE0TUF3_9PEZI|nr:hypothetical protein LTR78_007480 [Recurvomyces mirabilis]KAK5160010.1 hypothetical protein LTS14_002116 [Recurvomyces mirabilis]
MSTASFFLGSLALLGGVSAHIKVQTPTPFAPSSLDTSPLNNAAIGSSGSNFPCKMRQGGYEVVNRTQIKVGSAQDLIFSGSASHGGGVCQLAMTTDAEPNAQSEFKLFTVIEGCPIKDDSGSGGISPYSFKLPEGTPNGNLTLAWMWYNRIGNREIYMNCMPVEVTGGSDDKTAYNALSNAYIINQPTADCSTQETSDPIIPNPGSAEIQKFNPASVVSASGTACAASAAAMTKGVAAGSNSSPATASAAASSPPASSTASSSAPASYPTSAPSSSASSGGGMIGMNTSSASASEATAPASSAASPSVYSTMSASSAAVPAPSSYTPASGSNSTSSSSSPSSGSSDSGMTCSTDGTQFCVIANGQNVCRQVAAGTSCTNDQIVKRSVFRHPHIRRHV